MIVIAENINIMSKVIGAAMREKNPAPIRDLAVRLVENGADYLDINIGPARKGGAEMMEFVVKTVQEVAPRPLYLDTMNVEAMEAGLKAHNGQWGKPVINSIMARPERMSALIPLAKQYGAGFVALVYGPEGLPRDAAERAELAANLQLAAMDAGIPETDIWYDPIVVPVTSQQIALQGCTEFMAMLPDIAPTALTTCGLSNVSNCAPDAMRPVLNQTYLCILRHHGLKGAILDGLDKDILSFAKDQRKNLESVVGRIMDGETVDLGTLDDEERKFAKTAKVLLGHSLYSDSWLEL
jgi:5-methyltetrahydrofolate corrinoid/iron sulfur protein methyltransferase